MLIPTQNFLPPSIYPRYGFIVTDLVKRKLLQNRLSSEETVKPTPPSPPSTRPTTQKPHTEFPSLDFLAFTTTKLPVQLQGGGGEGTFWSPGPTPHSPPPPPYPQSAAWAAIWDGLELRPFFAGAGLIRPEWQEKKEEEKGEDEKRVVKDPGLNAERLEVKPVVGGRNQLTSPFLQQGSPHHQQFSQQTLLRSPFLVNSNLTPENQNQDKEKSEDELVGVFNQTHFRPAGSRPDTTTKTTTTTTNATTTTATPALSSSPASITALVSSLIQEEYRVKEAGGARAEQSKQNLLTLVRLLAALERDRKTVPVSHHQYSPPVSHHQYRPAPGNSVGTGSKIQKPGKYDKTVSNLLTNIKPGSKYITKPDSQFIAPPELLLRPGPPYSPPTLPYSSPPTLQDPAHYQTSFSSYRPASLSTPSFSRYPVRNPDLPR